MDLRKSREGQATVEAILLLTIFLAVSMSISQSFEKNNYFAMIIEGPWDFVDGMIQNGVWKKAAQSENLNPNGRFRHGSKEANKHTADASNAAQSVL